MLLPSPLPEQQQLVEVAVASLQSDTEADGRKPMFESDEEDYAAYDDPLYSTDSFRVGCFK